MAVPSSGTLNQLGLAQECLNGTYGSGSISGRICLETLVTSGQCGSQSEVTKVSKQILPLMLPDP